jgi:hypothetical protein
MVMDLEQCDELSLTNLLCIWVEGENENKCKEIRNSCNEIESEITCEFFGAAQFEGRTISCVWVEEMQTTKCQTVQASCTDIAMEGLCNTEGTSLSGNCFWVVGREPHECLEKV